MYGDDEERYSVVVMRREVEQAYFDLEFYSITGQEQVKKEESMLGVIRTTLVVLYHIAVLYHRLKRIKRRFNRIQRKHDRDIAKIARSGSYGKRL